jgi:hypothetical protein
MAPHLPVVTVNFNPTPVVDDDDDSSPRLAEALNLSISHARVRTCIRGHLNNPEVVAQIADLRRQRREQLIQGDTPAEAAMAALIKSRQATLKDLRARNVDKAEIKRLADANRTDSLKLRASRTARAKSAGGAAEAAFHERASALTDRITNISAGTAIVVATAFDTAVGELVRHAIGRMEAGGHKMLEVAYLHEGDVAALPSFPLVDGLPTWRGYSAEAEREKNVARAIAQVHSRVQPAAAAAPAGKKGKAGRAAGKVGFRSYVAAAIDAVKAATPAHAKLRVTEEMREHLAALVGEGVARVTALGEVLVRDVAEVHTFNHKYAKAVVDMLMVTGGRGAADRAALQAKIDIKLLIHKTFVEEEAAKKAAALTPEERAAAAARQAKLDAENRVKYAAQLAKREQQAAAAAVAAATAASKLKAGAPLSDIRAGFRKGKKAA